MIDQEQISQQNLANQQLMQSIKQAVDDLKLESHDKRIIEEQTGQLLKSVQGCLSTIKIQIERLKTAQIGYNQSRKDRTLNCDKIHNDHEQRLRELPGGIRCGQNEQKVDELEIKVEVLSKDSASLTRLEVVEVKVDNFTPLIYKMVGGVTVVALIVPPIVTFIFSYIIKQLKGD